VLLERHLPVLLLACDRPCLLACGTVGGGRDVLLAVHLPLKQRTHCVEPGTAHCPDLFTA
jgi:hypothetical protein